jgi:hypothetical protein
VKPKGGTARRSVKVGLMEGEGDEQKGITCGADLHPRDIRTHSQGDQQSATS